MRAPEEPATIGYAKLIALVIELGIETPANDIRSIHLEANRIEVVRYRRNADGHLFVAGNEPATETILIGVTR